MEVVGCYSCIIHAKCANVAIGPTKNNFIAAISSDITDPNHMPIYSGSAYMLKTCSDTVSIHMKSTKSLTASENDLISTITRNITDSHDLLLSAYTSNAIPLICYPVGTDPKSKHFIFRSTEDQFFV